MNLKLVKIACIVIATLVIACNSEARIKYVNQNQQLSQLLDSLNYKKAPVTIHIDKSDYKLSVLIDTTVIKQYPVVFGGNPVDDKLMQGDQCTPEGTFKIKSKYPHASWSKFIWIDYPNKDSWKKHNKAKQSGKIPKEAKIGGEIGIHGVPKGTDICIDLRMNWTLGCIAMKNEDVNEIYPYTDENTQVKIEK